MVRFLSSMRFAFWLLVALVLWFLAGVGLAVSEAHGKGVKSMGDSLIFHWLQADALSFPLVLVWFIVLCLIAFLLAVSFLFCTGTTLYRKVKAGASLRSVVLLVIHLLFIVIMALHLAGMLFGYKHSRVSLQPGESFSFGNGYRLELVDVVYVDDAKVLKLSYKKMRDYQTAGNFHMEENKAHVRLLREGEELTLGELRMLSPFQYDKVHITLNYFHIPRDGVSDLPGVMLVVARNPFTGAFFIFYGLAIFSILLYVGLTWRKPNI